MRKENEVMNNKEKLTERWTQGRISAEHTHVSTFQYKFYQSQILIRGCW